MVSLQPGASAGPASGVIFRTGYPACSGPARLLQERRGATSRQSYGSRGGCRLRADLAESAAAGGDPAVSFTISSVVWPGVCVSQEPNTAGWVC